MNKTKIEWVKNPDGTQGYTWNPITGCLNHTNGMCKGGGFPCYAYKLAHRRLKKIYLANDSECLNADFKNPFAPRFWFSKLGRPKMIKKPSGIFVCDMGELFGSWLEDEQCDFWQKAIFRVINECPQHRFYLLTKQPQNLINFSPFPDNCFVGVTVTTWDKLMEARFALKDIEAKVKYISFEPLLSEMRHLDCLELDINWLILGAMTGSLEDIKKMLMEYPQLTPMPWGRRWTLQPKIEWVEEIELATTNANIPIFEKDNLNPLLRGDLTREMPKVG